MSTFDPGPERDPDEDDGLVTDAQGWRVSPALGAVVPVSREYERHPDPHPSHSRDLGQDVSPAERDAEDEFGRTPEEARAQRSAVAVAESPDEDETPAPDDEYVFLLGGVEVKAARRGDRATVELIIFARTPSTATTLGKGLQGLGEWMLR